MGFKVTMLNDLGKIHEETILANNEDLSKMKLISLSQKSMIANLNLVYK